MSMEPERDPERKTERHTPYTALPGSEPAPGPDARKLLVPLAVAGALAAALGAGFLLTRAPAPARAPAASTAPAMPAPTEARPIDGLTAPRPAARAEAAPEASAAKPPAGACRRIFVPTSNAFQPYRQVDSCPLGKRSEITNWPQAGDCSCFSPTARGEMGK